MKKDYTFKTIVDKDIYKKYPFDPYEFEMLVYIYLNDPDGWVSQGYSFEYSLKNPDVIIHLSTPKTIENKCGLPDNLSCATLGGNTVYLNVERWWYGASDSKLDLEDYRQYVVSHEIGHILGFDHTTCPCPNCPAPIMMQQTLGIGKCIPNTKVINGGRKNPS
jgi:hypothetical protein